MNEMARAVEQLPEDYLVWLCRHPTELPALVRQLPLESLRDLCLVLRALADLAPEATT